MTKSNHEINDRSRFKYLDKIIHESLNTRFFLVLYMCVCVRVLYICISKIIYLT